jgi:hypothetical protein
MFDRIIASLFAILVTGTIALAAISGTWSEKQDEQAALGQLQVGSGTATGNTVTINNGSGVITTAALSTAAGATQSIVLNNNRIAVGDMIQATLDPNGSAGTPIVANATITAGVATMVVQNIHASAALNSAVKIYFLINKSGNGN